MTTWNRRQLWADHDAAHARRLRVRRSFFIVGVIVAWNTVAILGHSFDLALTDTKAETPADSQRAHHVRAHAVGCADSALQAGTSAASARHGGGARGMQPLASMLGQLAWMNRR